MQTQRQKIEAIAAEMMAALEALENEKPHLSHAVESFRIDWENCVITNSWPKDYADDVYDGHDQIAEEVMGYKNIKALNNKGDVAYRDAKEVFAIFLNAREKASKIEKD